ncbi:MAG: TRAP transporter substrate-binding protein DctP [Tissierellia bacterium]|nr:TRAP transporter substrate-binding protein DctP [Tissierellia bacterium]
MKSKKILIVMLIVFVTIFTACSSGGNKEATGDVDSFKPVTLRFANQHPTDSIASQSDKEICEEIEEATDGRVKVELYTDSSLGDYINIFEELMLGSIDMAHITAVESYDAKMTGSMLPYLGSNYQELEIAYDPDNYLYKTVYESAQKLGIRTFGFYCEGFSGIGVNKDVKDANIAGANKDSIVRVPGLDNFALPTAELGFMTSTIAYADTYTAIQTGVVDGWVGGPPNLNYLYFRDVIKNYYHYMLTQEATQIMMNENTFSSLLPEDQKAITDIIQSKCKDSIRLAEEDDNKYMEMLRDIGVNIVEFTDEERAEFAKAIRENVWPQLAKATSEEFIDSIVESLNK